MSLGTVEELRDYARSVGRPVSTQDAGPALLRGSNYLRGAYWRRLEGSPVSSTELFPRRGLEGLRADTVPVHAKYAEFEAAIMESERPGSLSPSVNPSVVREYVSGSVGREYRDDTGETAPLHTAIENLLAPWIRDESEKPMFMGSFGPRGL